jgi:hypothetical protein
MPKTIRNITVGNDSRSGLAYFIITEDGESKAVPYSVTHSRQVTGNHGADSIVVDEWFADREGLE